MEIVRVEGLSKRYFKEAILNNLSFSIEEGSITGVIGPNGAGKSTLFRILSGFEFQDSGEIFIKDKKVKIFNDRKEFISYMPENMKLYPDYYVYEFLEFYHSAIGLSDEKLIESLSLKKVYNKKIRFLSKGWHQRLKLYTALSPQKPLIILDEPFDGFDPLQMIEIINTIKKKNEEGVSFILSIHQLSDAEKICDYYILLDNGNLIAKGTIDELAETYSVKEKNLESIFLKALEK